MNNLEQLLGPISPITKEAPTDSVSFRDDLPENARFAAAHHTTAQSRPALAARAPFGDRANLHQPAAFEFGRPAAKAAPLAGGFKPFGAALSSHTATSAPTPASVACTEVGGATPMSTSVHDPATPSTAGAASAAAATPLPASTPAPSPYGGADAAAPATWGDVLLWRDPLVSVFWFAAGLGAYFTAGWALRGGAPVTPTSAAAYLLLAHLGLNFVRFFCSARWHAAAMWEGSNWADNAAEAAVRGVRRVAALHDAFLSSKDPHLTLAVALSLWALAWLGTALSANQLLLAGYVSAYVLPSAYESNRASVDAYKAALHRATLGRIDAMEMPRTTRLAVLSVALALLLVLTTWAQFAIGLLVAATYWRTTLAPAEVEAIRSTAEPWTHDVSASVRKVRARLGALYSTGGPATRTATRIGKAHGN